MQKQLRKIFSLQQQHQHQLSQHHRLSFYGHWFYSIGATLKFPEVPLTVVRMLIIVPATLRQDRVDSIMAAASVGDMVHAVVLHCDSTAVKRGDGFCTCHSAGGDYGCKAVVTDLVEEIRSSNVIVTFNHLDARHMMWAGLEAAVAVLDGPDVLVSSALTSSRLRLLQLHRFAQDSSIMLFVQSATPFLSDLQIVESAVRSARNFGRGMAFCGMKCGKPMKPQIWTPISYEWDNRKWADEVHTPYEKSMGWG